jgi:EAL domain-containing protein (putative c-di-GMP-specific phosphodiesterase class I)
MAVNVSAMEFGDERFVDSLFVTLRETRLDPRSLELELTENVLMKRGESTASILRTLRSRGVRVSVDDFGTGYSSLSHLRKFPIDALKIDQSFVHQIGTGGEDAIVVTAAINMAQSLKLRSVAEGVETQAELNFLRTHKCDEAQGFYFNRPVPAAEFVGLLERGATAPTMRVVA